MTKMYKVEITALVCANSEYEAQHTPIDISACDVEVYEAHGMGSSWFGDTYPFGDNQDKTCEQWLKEQRQQG